MVDSITREPRVLESRPRSDDPCVSLRLAAVLAFHNAATGPEETMQLCEYEHALDVTAAALSRLLTIYAVHPRKQQPVAMTIDLAAGRFMGGAMVYRRRQGSAIHALVVLREERAGAIDLLQDIGLTLYFRGAEAHRC